MKTLWEVLVPRYSNAGIEFSIEHHRQWDDYVRGIAGGITVFRAAHGQWVNPKGTVFKDEVIPVRIYCDSSDLDKIVAQTLEHYDQEAVFAYEVSQNVKVFHRKS